MISQRLVRRVCHHCSHREEIIALPGDEKLLQLYGAHETLSQKGMGCEKCGYTGYTGRIGIYEVLRVTDAVRDAIRDSKTDSEIHDIALRDGFLSLKDDARAKILLGMTTQEECEKNGIL